MYVSHPTVANKDRWGKELFCPRPKINALLGKDVYLCQGGIFMKKRTNHFLRIAVFSSFLAAMSIVFGKYLAINLGEVIRISFENTPVIFAGIAFGPIVGAVVGIVADLVGCLLVGYAINPLITVGAALIGAVSGIFSFFIGKREGVSRYLLIIGAIFLSHTVGSVLVKTAGLAAFYSMPYHVLMLWRALNYLIVGTLEALIIVPLISNKRIDEEIKKLGGKA